MLVTDKKYYMDEKYKSKLDLMIKRMTGSGTDDNILLVDGDEGQGKTEFTTGTCYYVSYITGRKYTIGNIFFDIDEVIKFASETKDQIIHWDEGALGGLTTQWWKQNQQKFIQLVMIARKKRHFMIICIPKFYKLNRYLIEERAIGLVHVYSRNNLQKGRFFYYTKRAKEKLSSEWYRKKLRQYNKYKSLRGSFVLCMEKIFGLEGVRAYDNKKDQAIMSLNKKDKEKDKNKEELNKIKATIATKLSKYTLKERGEIFGVHEKTIPRWNHLVTVTK